MPKTKDAVSIIRKMVGTDILLAEKIQEKRIHTKVARLIYQARTEAGLTQAELAKRIHTTQSAIARLEDADYEGQSLTMLQKIAEALGRKVELDMPLVKAGR